MLAWMLLWCLWTALLRPLSGQGWWEFLDRAGNYGVRLARGGAGTGSETNTPSH